MGGFDSAHGELAPHDLLWRLVEEAGLHTIEHIAEIQVESTTDLRRLAVVAGGDRGQRRAGQRAPEAHRCSNTGFAMKSCRCSTASTTCMAQRPLVSIIIAAGDSLSALQRCIESLIEQTAYAEYEILIVDKRHGDAAMADWLAAMAQLGAAMLRVLRL